MKLKLFFGFMLSLLLLLGSGAAMALPIHVEVYDTYSTTAGGGAPFSDFVGSFDSADIMFATDHAWAWAPFGLTSFGALMTGTFSVASDAIYSFDLVSDDGSMLYIDDVLVVDNGGPHSPRSVVDSSFLTAGLHSFRVEFYEDFGFPSGVDLFLPTGVSYAEPVPEPATMLLLGSGLIGMFGFKKKKKKS